MCDKSQLILTPESVSVAISFNSFQLHLVLLFPIRGNSF